MFVLHVLSISPHASNNQHVLPFPPHVLHTQMPKLFSQLPTSASYEPQLAEHEPAPGPLLPPAFLKRPYSCNTGMVWLKLVHVFLARAVEVVNASLLTNGLYSTARTSPATCSKICAIPHPNLFPIIHTTRLIYPSLLPLLALLSSALFVLLVP